MPRFETAEFKHVAIGTSAERAEERLSAIEILTVGSLQRRIAYISRTPTDSPSFTADGAAICFRGDGQLLRLELDGTSEPVVIGPPNAELCAVAAASAPPALRFTHEVKGGHAQIWRAGAGGSSSAGHEGQAAELAAAPRARPANRSSSSRAPSARTAAGSRLATIYCARCRPLGGAARELAGFFGGPGSLGASPWSPDGSAHRIREPRTGLSPAHRTIRVAGPRARAQNRRVPAAARQHHVELPVGAACPIRSGAGSVRRYAPGFSAILGFEDPQCPDFATLSNYCEPGEHFYCDQWTGRSAAGLADRARGA